MCANKKIGQQNRQPQKPCAVKSSDTDQRIIPQESAMCLNVVVPTAEDIGIRNLYKLRKKPQSQD